METEYIEAVPYNENCVQAGAEDCRRLSMLEMRALVAQLWRLKPDTCERVRFGLHSNAHDFGTYYDISVKGKLDDVIEIVDSVPARWDDAAIKELAATDYFQHVPRN